MKKLLKKKVNVFGKGIPVLAIFVLGIALVSAALIPLWGTITGSVIISQGFQVGGLDWDEAQATWSASLTSLEEETISSDDYTLINSVEYVDAEIQFTTNCVETEGSGGCEDVITTEMVKLSVIGFETGENPFDSLNYKKTYYNSPVIALDDLTSVTYSFEITERTGFADTTAPYVVLIGEGIGGSAGVAVQIIPDGENYVVGTKYTKTIDETTTFHTPGDSTCVGQSYENGCTLAYIKTLYPNAKLSQMSVAIGAWGGGYANTISAWMGIDKINDGQAVHKKLVVSEGEPSSLKIIADFPKMMKPDVYDFTTTITPVTA